MNYFIITGSSKGFGKAVSIELLKNDNNIVIGLSRSQASVSSAKYFHFSVDLSNPDFFHDVALDIFPVSENPSSIYLVNNAGQIDPIGPIELCESNHITSHFNVNILAPVLLSTEFIKKTKLLKVPKGIINISTGASKSPYFGWSCYCSSKASLEMFTQCLHLEKGDEYLIQSYDPGVVDTGMQETIRNQSPDKFRDASKFIALHSEGKLIKTEVAAELFVKKIFNF
jgi:benzil reductase ((S)-benzoin forming)